MKLIGSALCCLMCIYASFAIEAGKDNNSGQSSEKPSEGSLKLPSFSIFGLPLSGDQNEMNDLLDPRALDQFLATVRGDQVKRGIKERDYSWIIPMVFYKSRSLFEKDSWTSEDVRQGQLISSFFGGVLI